MRTETFRSRRQQFVSQMDAARASELSSLGDDVARRAASQSGRLADTLSPVPSQATTFSVDGAHAIHFLRARDGVFAGHDYCARIDLPGMLPAFLLFARGARDADAASFGPRAMFQHEALDEQVTARTRAPDVLRAFATDALAQALPLAAIRVALVRHHADLSVLEVDIDVGDGRQCNHAAVVAAQFGAVALALVRSNATFAERTVDTRPAADQLESLLTLLSSTTSWLSGPVARVGDGVEARLELDELEDRPCALRVDIDSTGTTTLSMRAPLKVTPTKTTTLTPQHGIVGALRGLVDVKTGDDVFDARWIVDGERDVAMDLKRAEGELAALLRVDAAIEHGVDGLVIRAPAFAFDADDVVDAIDASLRLWRRLVIGGHGLHDET